MKAYQERLITLLKDTITLLCRNGLEYDQEFCVEGLLGVTLDKNDVFLIPIKELVTDKGVGTDISGIEGERERISDEDADVTSETQSTKSERSRKRRRHKMFRETESGENEPEVNTCPDWLSQEDQKPSNDNEDTGSRDTNLEESPTKRAKHKDVPDIKSEDVVFIKEEVDDAEFASAFQDGSMDSGQLQNREGGNMDYFSQPGTSQGPLGFPIDQLPGASTSNLSGAMQGMPQQDADGSWLSNPGEMNQSQDWQQNQKHQVPQCHVCGQQFTLPWNLKRHIKSVHCNQRFECQLCHKTYVRSDSLRLHIEQHHKVHSTEGERNLCGPVLADHSSVSVSLHETHQPLASGEIRLVNENPSQISRVENKPMLTNKKQKSNIHMHHPYQQLRRSVQGVNVNPSFEITSKFDQSNQDIFVDGRFQQRDSLVIRSSSSEKSISP